VAHEGAQLRKHLIQLVRLEERGRVGVRSSQTKYGYSEEYFKFYKQYIKYALFCGNPEVSEYLYTTNSLQLAIWAAATEGATSISNYHHLFTYVQSNACQKM
jgi:hypothetical protein